ncbi:MAG: carboxysome shell carbonic anhydrase [bacterium]|nr:carboxysome shell carbonic anhydrase [bacterium]
MKSKINLLIELNKKHSELFCSQKLERDLYRAKHPTNVVAFKCMDGRIHLPVITQTPLGIISPFRNMGGRFDLGWPLLNVSFDESVTQAVKKGSRTLVLVTYHFSKGDVHRGCAGFNYDCEESKRSTANFRDQIRRIYGVENQVVFPVLIGIETDKDALILHGDNGEVVDVSTLKKSDEESLLTIIHRLFPNMPERIVLDFLPIIAGNLNQIGETKKQKMEAQLAHGEWVLAVGKGFDWLHTPNMAMIVGPYDPNIGEPIKTAAGIIKSNWESGRIEKGIVILASALYSDAADRARTQERAIFMKKLSEDIMAKNYPEMMKYMNSIAVVVNSNTMKMEVIE